MPSVTDDVVLDPAVAHPELGFLRAKLAEGDWWSCRPVLDAAAPDARTWLLRAACDVPGIADMLRYVLLVNPQDSTAAALLGMHLTDVGWQIRTGARANDVSDAQFEAFHDWLAKAEIVLIEGTARCPQDPALWSARLTAARGLSLGLSEAKRRYARLAAVDPHHLPGQLQYLQQICPKWGGDWDLLHSWATEQMLAAPPGAPQGVLVATAHLEHWLELPDDSPYLTGTVVREAVYQAAHRSIWHDGFRRDPGWVPLVSTFAMLFALMADQPAAAATFAMTGRLASEHPWMMIGDPVTEIRKYRRKAQSGAR
ncbi:hypothetical protein [Actinoplanes derwentensis]|uniref:DUF4034 domain-containing protein n=1 Tax=Actinoplanes derwentensis TaxID=113562 RepID=A0A1H1RGQ7_9ACTN|nr:hypothetical protein [Actinoplanes derwentensis]GID89410.1 hypothetical protein Ade03nite_83340 [Actinoplanes derwentensis]SDS34746.1 hypothetical protein SAMN04489716_0582 [Actinoplanes derwentensis]